MRDHVIVTRRAVFLLENIMHTTIDWCDKEQVIAYAKKLGTGMSVIKYPDRNNYNITHTERAVKLGVHIIYKT